jgi:hypothetical protein
MQSDIDAGFRSGQVASRNGVHRETVLRLVRRGLLVAPDGFHQRGNKPGFDHFQQFPKWLPRDLRSDYHDNAVLYGEEHAARLARAAKAEAMMVEA